jgi:ATP-dependent DNA ligase
MNGMRALGLVDCEVYAHEGMDRAHSRVGNVELVHFHASVGMATGRMPKAMPPWAWRREHGGRGGTAPGPYAALSSETMRLPFQPPLEPMLAKPADGLPTGDGWLFEPKWDGFRALVFRDGDEVYTQSRELKPLDRYFPELGAPLRAVLPDRCVLDGEIVIVGEHGLEF